MGRGPPFKETLQVLAWRVQPCLQAPHSPAQRPRPSDRCPQTPGLPAPETVPCDSHTQSVLLLPAVPERRGHLSVCGTRTPPPGATPGGTARPAQHSQAPCLATGWWDLTSWAHSPFADGETEARRREKRHSARWAAMGCYAGSLWVLDPHTLTTTPCCHCNVSKQAEEKTSMTAPAFQRERKPRPFFQT